MVKHFVNVGTILTVLATGACGSVPYLTYVDDDASGSTTPSSDPPDATAPIEASTTPPSDTGSPIGDAPTTDAGCGGSTLPTGYVCCADVVCKGDSCGSDTCSQCPTNCPLPMICCEQKRGGNGGEVRCSPINDCK